MSMLLTTMGLLALVVLARVPVLGGDDLWDLAAVDGVRPDRDELVAGLRSGELTSDDIVALRRSEGEHQGVALWGLGLAVVLVGVSFIATALVHEHADAPLTALAVWLPAALGLILLTFGAGPRFVESLVYRRWTLAPAAMIAELVEEQQAPAVVAPDLDPDPDPDPWS
jgi:hypothetical protein